MEELQQQQQSRQAAVRGQSPLLQGANLTRSLLSNAEMLPLVCSFLCRHSIRLELCSPGREMLHFPKVGLATPAGMCGSVLSVISMPLAKVTFSDPSGLTR